MITLSNTAVIYRATLSGVANVCCQLVQEQDRRNASRRRHAAVRAVSVISRFVFGKSDSAVADRRVVSVRNINRVCSFKYTCGI
jgi:hypothetical protein